MLDDDSFISITESGLDHLYKAVYDLNVSIKETESKFWAANSRGKRAELQEFLSVQRQKRDEYLK